VHFRLSLLLVTRGETVPNSTTRRTVPRLEERSSRRVWGGAATVPHRRIRTLARAVARL